MDKMLHERLRDHVKRDGLDFDGKGYSLVLWSFEAEALADEIERFYIPRPRFEDGEPVQWDDESIDWNTAVNVPFYFNAIDNDGIPLALGHDTYREAQMTEDGFVKRKERPKILDCDGNVIEIGDTVWCLTNGLQKGKVRYIYSYGVQVEWEDGYRSDGVNPDNLTHKGPDSLEKLREDVDCMLRNLECDTDTADEIERRFFALIERGA